MACDAEAVAAVPERVEFTLSPWRALGVLGGGLALVGGSLLLVLWGEGLAAIVGQVGAVLFGVAWIVGLARVLRGGTQVVLSRDGILDERWGVGWIAWGDVVRCWAAELNHQPLLCLELRDPEPVLERLTATRRALARGNRALGFGDLTVGFTALRPGIDAALAFVEHVHGAGGMAAGEVAAMASDWCEFQRTFATSAEWQRRRQVAERLDSLCRDDPGSAWAVLLEIARIEVDHDILGTLAEGPLALLVEAHGPDWIDSLEAQARRDAKFRGVLARCSPERLDPALWRRLLAVSGRGG